MAESESESTESKADAVVSGPSKETYALYYDVKHAIFEKYEEANRELSFIHKNVQYKERHGPIFQALVLALYVDLAPKLGYPKYSDKFKELNKLRDVYDGKHALSFEDAKKYFFLIRELIEALGITKFEREKLEPVDEMMSGGVS